MLRTPPALAGALCISYGYGGDDLIVYRLIFLLFRIMHDIMRHLRYFIIRAKFVICIFLVALIIIK